MTQRHIKAAYAKLDPAHVFDGLFVPTKGKPRGRLLVKPRMFGGIEIGFQGFEQLGCDDQNILLAVTAQLGINGLVIDGTTAGPVAQELRAGLEIKKDNGAAVATKRTSLRSLLLDAGYANDSGDLLRNARESLNRLRATQIRQINRKTGWDQVCNLVSVAFNVESGEIHVAANPRITGAVFHGQHVKISLFERNELESEVAKLLHCWLCSSVRPGRALGAGNGVKIDTLAPHIWGQEGWEGASAKVKSTRRGRLREALDEIRDKTRSLHDGYGWEIEQTQELALVSRPKNIPVVERMTGCKTPSELHDFIEADNERLMQELMQDEWQQECEEMEKRMLQAINEGRGS